MKVIVTGGAGFIGSHIADSLISEGHEVVILDDFSAGNREFVNAAAKVLEADIRDSDAVNRAFAEHRPKAVFHLAAMIELRESFKDPKAAYGVNVAGSLNVINASKQAGVKKFIFSSSAAVYGDNQNLPIKESEPIKPTSPYGEQKAEIENVLRASGIPSIILRHSNVYGPRQGTRGEGGVVAIFCKRLAASASLTIFGEGEQTRDFVFVDDVVKANTRVLQSGKNFAVYNVSTGIETSVNQLANLLLSASQKEATIEHTESISGEALRNSLDNRFARETLSWEPKTSIPEGLQKTWEWFSANL